MSRADCNVAWHGVGDPKRVLEIKREVRGKRDEEGKGG